MPPLKNIKYEMWAQAFFKTKDPDEAARSSGFKCGLAKTGSTAAATTMIRMLKRPEVKARLNELAERSASRIVLTKTRVLKETCRIAFTDPRRCFNTDGSLVNIEDLPEDVARAISSIEVDELFVGSGKDRVKVGHTKKIKFWDKGAALTNLMKFYKLFSDDDGRDKTPNTHFHFYMPDNGRQGPAVVNGATGPSSEATKLTATGEANGHGDGSGTILSIPSNGRG